MQRALRIGAMNGSSFESVVTSLGASVEFAVIAYVIIYGIATLVGIALAIKFAFKLFKDGDL